MRIKRLLGLAVLIGFSAAMFLGCSSGTQVPLAPAPAVQETPAKPLPKDRKGGGSGLMKRNPGASS